MGTKTTAPVAASEKNIVSNDAHESGRPSRPDSWFKSSFSAEGTCCVEVRSGNDVVYVRDSKHGRQYGGDVVGTVLSFTREEWRAFVEGAKAGEFDL